MAQQIITLGSAANDRTGDNLRTGGDKINDNFTELYNVKNPAGVAENDFIVAAPTTFAWVRKSLAQVKTILGLGDVTQAATFANPLALDATTHKDFKCASVTGNTTVNLSNVTDGDAGLIELIIDAVGGYTVTLGTMFTKNSGGNVFSAPVVANEDYIIAWYKSGTDIIYSITQVE